MARSSKWAADKFQKMKQRLAVAKDSDSDEGVGEEIKDKNDSECEEKNSSLFTISNRFESIASKFRQTKTI